MPTPNEKKVILKHTGGAETPQPSTDLAQARILLKSWLAEDNTSDRSVELLKTELDKYRESSRKLFPREYTSSGETVEE